MACFVSDTKMTVPSMGAWILPCFGMIAIPSPNIFWLKTGSGTWSSGMISPLIGSKICNLRFLNKFDSMSVDSFSVGGVGLVYLLGSHNEQNKKRHGVKKKIFKKSSKFTTMPDRVSNM